MVQNFAFFADRLGAAKIKNRKILNGQRKRLMSCMQMIGMVVVST
jgi:hypothetical protein